MDYIAEEFTDSIQLLPSDPLQKAKINYFNEIVGTVTSKTFYPAVMNMDISKKKEFEDSVRSALSLIDASLPSDFGPYFLGQSLSTAEIFVIPHLARFKWLESLKDIHVPWKDFPRVSAWLEKTIERPAFKSTWFEKAIIEDLDKMGKRGYTN